MLLLLVAARPTLGQAPDDTSPARPHLGNIINLFVSPLRSTMDQARRLIRNPLGGARDMVSGGFNEIQKQTFNVFMQIYNKTYSVEEIPRRMALYFDRRKLIEESVHEFAKGRLPFMMRENTFVDWDDEELKMLAGVSPPKSVAEMTDDERAAFMGSLHQGEGQEERLIRVRRSFNLDGESNEEPADEKAMVVEAQTESIPASKDWRASGCVSAPRNQHMCGACYAIATMSVVESMRCLNGNSSPILSPQQIIDCATPRAGYQNHGCDGGWPTRVLKYLEDNDIAARESCYPFVRRQEWCKLNSVKATPKCTVSASSSGSQLRYKVLNNERDVLYHVAKTGPVVTVMKASDKFLYYDKGIFDDPKCSNKRDDVDHAIVIVGYGRENGMDYWLIKNSWGTRDWGEGGYGKYRRGKNACSIGHWGWVVLN